LVEKIHFADLVKDAKSVASFIASANFDLDRMALHRHGLAAQYIFKMAVSKVEYWAPFETTFFRIAGTLEAQNSVSEKKPNVYLI